VLLHGLISTGDVFGAAYDRLAVTGRIVVPDLLGFGRSMDDSRSTFSVDDHLDALDEVAARTGLLTSARWTIGAHSMGSALALRWAARHHDQVARVVCWGAPVYHSPDAARARIGGSTMARLFALDTDLAARACAISCRHRTGAGWLSAVAEPRLPIPVARAASLHTWPAYRDAIRHLVIDTEWAELIGVLDLAGTPVHLVWGSRDRIGDRSHADAIASQCSRATITSIKGAGHHLPMTHPQVCIGQLAGRDDSG
jgi:pimeloyl-ACP methyl ester carboxylesterase